MALSKIHTLNRSDKDRLFSISIPIETPSDRTYKIMNNTAFSFDVVSASSITASGTCTANVKINGTSVTGLSAIACTSSRLVSTATANNSVAVGGVLSLDISSTSSADMLNIVLTCRRTGLED